jgi:hypothetical protein
MNIIFTERTSNIFLNKDLAQTSEYLMHLQKFNVNSISNYFNSLKSQINANLKSLNLKTHFNLLYTQTKQNEELVPLKSPLYISFLLKISEKIFDSNNEKINPIKLAWVITYHSYLDLNTNAVLEQTLKSLISFMRKENCWVNEYDIQEIIEVLIMVDSLKLFDVNVPKSIVEFFDKEIIANLIRSHVGFSGVDPRKGRVYELLEKQQGVRLEMFKLTNVFYVDALVEYENKVNIKFLFFFLRCWNYFFFILLRIRIFVFCCCFIFLFLFFIFGKLI